jgi:hypothetical protein
MNICHQWILLFLIFKKMKRKKFTSLNVGQTIDSLLCNLRRRAQVASSTTFVRIVYWCVLKYQFSLDVVGTFFIKIIAHWPPLYVSRSCSYSTLKSLPRTKTSQSNSPSPSTINNCFSPLFFPFPLTPTMMIIIIAKL